MRLAILAYVAMMGAAWAEGVPVEVNKLAGQQVTLHVHPFLTETDLKTLRLVAKNKQALQMFVTGKGFAAIAVAPEEGFVTDGVPAPSAVALSDLPDAATAATEALKGCDGKRKGKVACVLVLEVGLRADHQPLVHMPQSGILTNVARRPFDANQRAQVGLA